MESDNSLESSVSSLARVNRDTNTPAYNQSHNNYHHHHHHHHRHHQNDLNDFDMDHDDSELNLRERFGQEPFQHDEDFYNTNSMNRLPPEILLQVFSNISQKSQLLPLLTVCKKWANLVVELLWFRPSLMDSTSIKGITKVMTTDDTFWDYKSYIRRLNLSFVVDKVNDDFLNLFSGCSNLERLTLVNCSKLSHNPIVKILQGCSKLQSVDMTGVKDINDAIFNALSENCPRLQGLYAPQCQNITNEAFLNIINSCTMLKRVKVSDCSNITDDGIIKLTENCKLLIEVDVHNCMNITDFSLQKLFTDLEQLREFRISHNPNVSDAIFKYTPEDMILDRLRILDFTGCIRITDKSVERIVQCAPRLRNVILSKCLSITDASLRALATLGKNLHYIHLGHCSNITDFGVTTLVRNCHRLQYIDLACCAQLTNTSLLELAYLPRLRRIGLVKCANINDSGIIGLIQRRSYDDTLERVHLSYCTNLTLFPIYQLLLACPRLTHLSLTGISVFLRDDILRFCRSPPSDFNEHQKQLFCVFSGQGVKDLRKYLSSMYSETNEIGLPLRGRERIINDELNIQAERFFRGGIVNAPAFQQLLPQQQQQLRLQLLQTQQIQQQVQPLQGPIDLNQINAPNRIQVDNDDDEVMGESD
ncbi:hypothetical protein WICMUC_001183 [Wickerhamomyces mucosus]|uniref:F-box domain-containing protein n=1 Tax=Wickerhamomyces mucosus TaxID=1378264 RepID=A0A9P8PVH7_9ASCO|nr:hypothetical protein WICMUC_001183 [Wickerhamomyces mucosus]